jgi:hypothetical protein
MRKLFINVSILLIIPAAVYAGFNFGLVKAAKKVGDKVDEKVLAKKNEAVPITVPVIANSSPAISSVMASPISISTGAISVVTCAASDIDGDTLTYIWSAASGTVSGAGATINWTAPSSSGTYIINVTVSDGHGESVQSSTNVVVTKLNNPPQISSISPWYQSTFLTSAVSTITVNASDADNDALTYVWAAASGTISGSGATVHWTPPASPGTYTIGVTVSDGQGGSVQANTNVVVVAWLTYTTASGLANNSVYSIAIDGSGNKWFGTWGGVSKFDGTTWTTYTTANGLADNHVQAIAIDSLGNKWFGTGGGISKFDGTTWTNYTTANGLVSNNVQTITIDASGNKWFGTDGGVSKFDGTTWTSYTTASGLVDNRVYAIAIDSSGNKWFGTLSGVSKFDGASWTTYTTANGLYLNWVLSIAIDSSGNKWFGTDGYGVSRFDGTSWSTIYPTLANGNYGNTFQAILIESSGDKWFATNNGLERLSWVNCPISLYTTVMSITTDSSGNKWFGTDAGVAELKVN